MFQLFKMDFTRSTPGIYHTHKKMAALTSVGVLTMEKWLLDHSVKCSPCEFLHCIKRLKRGKKPLRLNQFAFQVIS